MNLRKEYLKALRMVNNEQDSMAIKSYVYHLENMLALAEREIFTFKNREHESEKLVEAMLDELAEEENKRRELVSNQG